MITIDGAFCAGGGQVLRTALSLSLVTQQPFRIENIRAGRQRPGLLHQHLAAVTAASAIGQAKVTGAALGSRVLEFEPQTILPGEYAFAVGTAGSVTLVLQTVLPALALASGPSSLVLEGGTHNPMAPPVDFLEHAFLPLLHRMGPAVRLKLDRYGFYPAGGGKIRVTVQPAAALQRLDLLERGAVTRCSARSIVANLPSHIAERELKVLKHHLHLRPADVEVHEAKSAGPGNVVLVRIDCAHLTEVFAGFGQQGVRAEVVAEKAAQRARQYLDGPVPVAEHLADQLLLPIALAGGGCFRTFALSQHSLTNLEVLKKFLNLEIKTESAADGSVRIELRRND